MELIRGGAVKPSHLLALLQFIPSTESGNEHLPSRWAYSQALGAQHRVTGVGWGLDSR